MDQHALAGLQLAEREQRLIGGAEHFDHRSRLHVAPSLGNLDRELLVDERIFRICSGGDEAENPLATPEAGYLGSGRDDVAGQFEAEDVALARWR
ncbi:hypothetical protein GALL_517690 [mine drainage metagenome]|uniref:Uncharacterized protein n=1 Tax=mine drainage metagenome TaxID=410659 RepID=A0A1J5P632_9ZZZZ